ncbi:5963_t:CDS:2 [Dentiscutata erythropus]|uniref:5963_t:CDS:1 n=1 Tax=Dentiscutata erythropus TaxID=1348616 RepID=A0A9N9CPG8_9GLOM|nr:5963_t:CDS:2 [Dentiscutata erythropus]
MSTDIISVDKEDLPPTVQSPNKNEVLVEPDQKQDQWKIGEAINLIVGAGIFIAPGSTWRLVQSPGAALILWIIGGVINLYGFLVWRLSEKGPFESTAYGFAFNNQLFRFLFGFATVNIIIPAAIIANSFIASKYLLYAIQGADGEEFNHYGKDFGSYFGNDFIALRLIAVALLGIITAYHMLAIRSKHVSYAVCLNQVLVVFKVVSLLVLSLYGLLKANDPSFSSSIKNNWNGAFNHTLSNNYSYPRTASESIGGYGNALLQVYSSIELREECAYRKYSALVRVCVSFILYILVNVAFISIVDPKVVADPNNANESIAIDYGIRLFGDFGRKYMSYLIAISSFSSMDSMVLL